MGLIFSIAPSTIGQHVAFIHGRLAIMRSNTRTISVILTKPTTSHHDP